MGYKRRVCGRRTATAIDMCKHMTNSTFRFEEHVEWIESHGINYTEMLDLKEGKLEKGSYKALTELVEKECKIQV